MRRKFVSMTTISLVLVLLSVLLRIQVVEAVIPYVYIRADGSVDPSFAPISSVDNITYTFTNDLYIPVIVERDNIIIDGAGYTLSRNGTGRGIDLTSRHNITIKSLQIRSFQSGIWLAQASDCKIIENKISNSTFGVWVFGSNNTLYGNTVGNNSDSSVVVDFGSTNNTVYENNIMNSSRGVWLIMASDNKFFHNNFVDNIQHVHAQFSGYGNLWDNGYPSGGNYWSGYPGMDLNSGSYQNETGRDGIGDTAYTIDADNTDHYPFMTSYSPIYQGDFVLTDNDVYAIEGRFDINGSIIVKENATLILRNAIINFTHHDGIFLQNPVNGNPRLRAENTNIVNVGDSRFYENSSAIFSNCTMHEGGIYYYDKTEGTILNSTFGYIQARGSSKVSFFNSTVEELDLVTQSANSSIINLTPGLFDFWDFWLNCSVSVSLLGRASNVTLTQTIVQMWSFSFQGSSNAEIKGSEIGYLHANQYSQVSVYNSTLYSIELYYLAAVRLTNSTCSTYRFFQQTKVYVSWYLDVHVIDSIGQNVPSANVTATYPNATVAEQRLTDANGWARLTLTEKMMNATGSYSIGNYTVTAKYETHEGQQSANMTENKQITMQLPFIIPEFPSFLILPLFILTTLLAVIIYKRKHLK